MVADVDAERDEHVALFVDHENVYISLREKVRGLSPEQQAAANRLLDVGRLAEVLLENADRYGWVRVKLAVANWEALPGHVGEYGRRGYRTAYNLPGRNAADLKILNEIRDVLEDPDYSEVGTFIIATGDGGYFDVLQTLLDRRKQVHIWGVRGSTSPLIEARATFFRYIDDLLGLELVDEEGAAPSGAETPSAGASAPDVTPLEGFVILLDDELRQHGWQYLNFTRMLDFMINTGLFGREREEALGWLNLAKEQAVLLEQIIELAPQQGRWQEEPLPTRLRKLRLNRGHPLVQRALSIRDAVLDTLSPTVAQRREVLFGTVLTRLRSEPQFRLTEVQAKNWLAWFIRQGYVLSRTAPHRTLPQVQVSLLRLNPERAGVAPGELSPEQQQKVNHLVVVLDNYLARNPRFTWMAASTLLSRLAPPSDEPEDQVGREAAREALRLAGLAGYLTIGSVPNRRFGGVTQTVVPRREHPHVQGLLRTRDGLLRLLATMLSSRPSVARSTFVQRATDDPALGGDAERVEWWLGLLVQEGSIVLGTLAEAEGEGPVVATLGLNYQDLLVARLLSATP